MKYLRILIPNAFTAGNLLLGVLSIVYAAKGEMTGAGLSIFLAAFLDFFDGFTARLLRSASDFGKEFDSLADTVTFGAAPSLLLFYLTEPYITGWSRYLVLLLALASAIRLARFNTIDSGKPGFNGLPTPAMGITVASFPLIIEFDKFNIATLLLHPLFAPVFALVFSGLMVSTLPMFSLKFKSFGWEQNKLTYSFLALCLGILALLQFVGIPFIVLTYVFLSFINTFANR